MMPVYFYSISAKFPKMRRSGNLDRHAQHLEEPLEKWFNHNLEVEGRFVNRLGDFQDLRELLTFSGSITFLDWDAVKASRSLNPYGDSDDHFLE